MTATAPVHERDKRPADRNRASQPEPPMAVLRADTCAILDGVDDAAKGRASIVRSCSEARGLSEIDRDALKDLLRCITEQRKRLRALRRLWQSLDVFERPSAGLVDATELCLWESREMAEALEPWRAHTIAEVSQTVCTTWARLVATAAQFTPESTSGRPVAIRRPA